MCNFRNCIIRWHISLKEKISLKAVLCIYSMAQSVSDINILRF